MLKSLLVASASLLMVGAALAADLPRPEPVQETAAPIGKAPIGKAPVGKAPEPIYTKG
ncbi:Uncharacterised protein [Starkeya nomas]|uniref:Uncharacterized protein n=1 Tax=Starkeya nomas TaxID=2666134 RepID=A0A5S9P8P4_9HYPH|nr:MULTISPECIES: hypothetical protein [Xanthobacteraceae]CAA0099862.1 Uncharacterised protein [Starkeya nomas]